MWARIGADNLRLDRQPKAAYMTGVDEDLKEFLRDRRAAKAQRELDLVAELDRLRSEIASIDAALAALSLRPPTESAGDKPKMTIKEGVIEVLKRVYPEGLTALSILERLRVDVGLDYPRTSLSPQLSRLKNEKKVMLKGNVWYLNKENGPEV